MFFQIGQQLFAAGLGRIDAQAQRRDRIEILAEPFRIVRAIGFDPAADEPFLLMIGQGQVGYDVSPLSGMTNWLRRRILLRSMALTNLAMPRLPNFVAILTASLQAADLGTLVMPKI